jgi:hypothetical protein
MRENFHFGVKITHGREVAGYKSFTIPLLLRNNRMARAVLKQRSAMKICLRPTGNRRGDPDLTEGGRERKAESETPRSIMANNGHESCGKEGGKNWQNNFRRIMEKTFQIICAA